MNRLHLSACALFLLCWLGIARSEDLKAKRGSVCWPLHFSGITLGLTTDPQVQRLLGVGVFRKNQGDTGGRYFVDAKGTATLHVVAYTDFVVGEITLRTGIDPAIKADEQKLAVSKWFIPDDGFGNWHALHLGSSKEEVLKNLGEPKEKVSANNWMYETSCTCELPEFFNIFFKDGHVDEVFFFSTRRVIVFDSCCKIPITLIGALPEFECC